MKTILIFSGGLDSTTLLYQLRSEGDEVRCLSFFYGQRHKCELVCAAAICKQLEVEHQVVDLSSLKPLLTGSALSDENVTVPEGPYQEKTMTATVVPNRNMIMLSAGIAWAVSTKLDRVAYAAHGGDHAIYPDCRPNFVTAIDAVAQICDWHRVRVIAPYLQMNKAQIVKRGLGLNVPYNLTWTCYKGAEKPCGVCGSCDERREAFQINGVSDPLEY